MQILEFLAACFVVIIWLALALGLISAGVHGIQEVWGLLQ